MYLVTVTEHERGYGQRVISKALHESRADAEYAANKVNCKNTSTNVPDYYIKAEVTKIW